MDVTMELVNALNALTAVLQKFTQQTTENYLNTFEELPTGDTDDAPAAESQPAPKPTVTIEQVRAVLSELSRAGKTVQVKELLAATSSVLLIPPSIRHCWRKLVS